jgi:hypothetical protein
VKTLREITDDAQTAYFLEVLTATGGHHEKAAKIMGISVATYYRRLSRLFPVERYSKSAFVLATIHLPPTIATPEPTPALEPTQTGSLDWKPGFKPQPQEGVAALQAERRQLREEARPRPVDPFVITEDDLIPGPYYLTRRARNSVVVTDIDWGNREVDFKVGAMPKRTTIEDFLQEHMKAMV